MTTIAKLKLRLKERRNLYKVYSDIYSNDNCTNLYIRGQLNVLLDEIIFLEETISEIEFPNMTPENT